MMKLSNKVDASLQRRQETAKQTGPNPKHVAHKPGSQNRTKGASARRSTR